jgi:hypothetical protein
MLRWHQNAATFPVIGFVEDGFVHPRGGEERGEILGEVREASFGFHGT